MSPESAPFVLVSNRGPVTFEDDGTVRRGTGGLVTALTGLAYQRSHEREADCFAIAVLKSSNMSTAPMGDLLLAMAAKRGKDDDDEDKDGKEKSASSADSPASTASAPTPPASKPKSRTEAEIEKEEGMFSLLSTHPETVARAKELKAGISPHCAATP